MKIFLKRRNFLFLFIVFIIVAIICMTYNLNQIVTEDLSNGNVKDEVKFLRSQIDMLEKKAAENEKNLKNLQRVYKKADSPPNKYSSDKSSEAIQKNFNRNLSDIIPNRDFLPKLPDLNLFDRFRMDKFKFMENQDVKSIQTEVKVYHKQCEWFAEQKPTTTDIEIADLMSKLPFDDIDGGEWKQGFEISYDPKQWNQNKKLHVFIVPHSHNDPGWLMTFEEYFAARTKSILDTIVNSLSEKKTRKFIWAETSYLSLWWKQASEEMRSKLKHLIVETKQLEIVTGGWVMTDEANSHYYAMIEQMIEGHEWLKANIDPSIRPTSGWSIDPFGYTPTMAYLLKQMGFDAMLIQRVHYHIKKYMAQTLRFEFNWKQSFTTENSKDTSIFCHVMPFYSYDIPHTCGPNPKICCQFDFKRMSGEMNCPWGVKPQRITSNNVHERAKTLLDQYRKKSQLYGDRDNHNVLLIPLGDDFRYRDMTEANDQFENYERLMEYINSQADWNAEVKFGTLKDYFDFLSKNNAVTKKKIETFSGDFFTYADRQDHYWSGYYTSRPFNKRLDRLVEYYLRSAEILFSFANLYQEKQINKFTQADSLYKLLLVARRNLGVFQHHDGITGTSKTPVVQDYANKLFDALQNSKQIMENSISYLISNEHKSENIFSIEDVRLAGNDKNRQQKLKPVIILQNEQDEQKVLLYNSNLNQRVEIVSFRINSPDVEVIDSKGLYLENVQVSLVWPNMESVLPFADTNEKIDNNNDLAFSADFDSNSFELLFEVNLPPLSLTTYTIRRKTKSSPFSNSFNNVTFYYENLKPESVETATKKIYQKVSDSLDKSFTVNFKSNDLAETVENMIKIGLDSMQLQFSPQTGLLNKIITDTKEIKSKIKFIKYGTTSASEKSGAYLFLPDGPGVELNSKKMLQWIRVEHSGKLRNRVCANMTILLHCMDIYPTVDRIKNLKYPIMHVWNMVDLRRSHNLELAMHIETDIKNDDFLHTDLNGFQYIKRKNYKKLTIQGNVYPMPSGAFVQDSTQRLNILTAQPLGVASLDPSSIQVFLDRRLDQDDNRGMEQAMNDNVLVSSKFVIFFEAINGMTSSTDKSESLASNYPSLMSQLLSSDLINSVTKMVLTSKESVKTDLILSNKNKKYPCDLRLVNMRTMQTRDEKPLANDVGLIFHRIVFEDCPSSPFAQLSSYYINQCSSDDNNQFSFDDFFEFFTRDDKSTLKVANITNTLLTLQRKSDSQSKLKTDSILDHLQPMQIEAYRINFN